MTKIYVVTCGSYSDYHIVGVFDEDHHDLAKDVASRLSADDRGNSAEVEEYVLNTPGVTDEKRQRFQLELARDGTVVCLRNTGPYPREYGIDWSPRIVVDLDAPAPQPDKPHSGRSFLEWSGFAVTMEHAIRSANEIRRQVLAGQCPPGVGFVGRKPSG